MRFGISFVVMVLVLALSAFATADPLGKITMYKGLRETAVVRMTAPGPDGNIWFIDGKQNSEASPMIGRITPSGTITEYLQASSHALYAIVAGPGGEKYLWVTDHGETPSIGRIDSANPEAGVTWYSSGLNAGSEPVGITSGPDGNLWFTDTGTTKAIGTINPSAPEGSIKECSTGLNAEAKPLGIIAGPDGNLWFVDDGTPTAVGKTNPSTCESTEFATGSSTLPGGVNDQRGPWGIAPGPDGNVWYTENGTSETNGKAICRITPSGTITCFKTGLIATSSPTGLTAGPDGKLWFSDTSNKNEAQELEIKVTEGALGGTYKLGFGGKETGWEGKGTLTSASKTVPITETKSGIISKGEEVLGTGIPAGATITACVPTTCGPTTSSITLSLAATASGTTELKSDLQYKATNLQVKEALTWLPTIDGTVASGFNLTASGSGTTSPIKRTVEFKGKFESTNQPLLTCNGAGLTGTGVTCSIKESKEAVEGAIASITTSGAITRYPSPALLHGPAGIAAGPDGNLWFSAGFLSFSELGKFGIEPPAPTNRRTLTLTKSGTGQGAVASKPKGIKCGNTCPTSEASIYKETKVVLTAKAAATVGSNLEGWEGCESTTTISATEGTCTVTMSAAKAVVTKFGGTKKAILNPVGLTVSKVDNQFETGYGTVKASGIACEADCTSTEVEYTSGDGGKKLPATVTLLEIPTANSSFDGWKGCDSEPEGKCVVTMSKAKSVTASFTLLPKENLTLTKSGTGQGAVASKPKGIKCGNTCPTSVAALPQGTKVVLTAKAAATAGSNLEGWEGCESTTTISATEGTCTTTMSAAKAVVAKFGGTKKAILNPVTLTVTKVAGKSGTSGTVKASGIACEPDCTSTQVEYTSGDGGKKLPATVTLIAISAPGSKTVVWSGCDSEPEGKCVVTMSKAKEVTATFSELE
jgi:streptogramin lyase